MNAQPEIAQMRQPTLDRFRYERLLHRSGLAPNTRYVLCVLAHYTDAKTLAIPARYVPSQKTLAEDTGLSLATIKRALADAEASGWLGIEHTRGRGRRAGYALTVPDSAPGLLRVVDNPAEGTPKRAHSEPFSGAKRAHSEPFSGAKRAHSEPLPYKETNSSSNGGGAAAEARAVVAGALGLGADDDDVSRIIETITTRHSPRNLAAYLTGLAARGELEKYRGARACARPGESVRMSEACLRGAGPECGRDWCGCQCHATRTAAR